MPSDSATSPQLEIAHVLFMDMVAYTRMKTDEQLRILSELQSVVRDTPTFRRAESVGELIRLPTGDGMALAFFHDPIAPVQCAVEIASALKGHPNIRLRLGVHTGPVYRIEDINANLNVSGGGINMAQRVMDCGDAGHIILSYIVADMLDELSMWAPHLHDLGDAQVKHGIHIHVFNLYTGEVGNPDIPSKLQKRPLVTQTTAVKETTIPQVPEHASEAAPSEERAQAQVALIYRRHLDDDEHLLSLFETGLAEAGYRVFVDRHMSIGVEWAKEIERQIRASDAVLPILSEGSMHSEMLTYEIEIAHDATQHQDGKPRILPVRIRYEGPLPGTLATILDPIQYTLWNGAEDDARVVADVLRSLRGESVPEFDETSEAPSTAGGALPLDSRYYIARPVDEPFHTAIAKRSSIVLVKGARQMGKTSLLARGLQKARETGATVVVSDFQEFNVSQLASVEKFFLALADSVYDQLDLDTAPKKTWDDERGPSANFERYIRRTVLPTASSHIVWGMDEVDRLFTCDFGSEVFGLFRSWHNKRSLEPSGPWSKLTLVIVYATEAHLFITDVNQSPFNVGTRLSLDDFNYDQVADLIARYGSPLATEAEIRRYFRLVGGQPYLVQRGLQALVEQKLSLAELEATADRDDGAFGDHLRRILVLLARDQELSEVMRGVLRGEPCPTPQSFYRLRSAGVLVGDSARDARLRCQLYTTYLERHLL